jgi:hypothetical protein
VSRVPEEWACSKVTTSGTVAEDLCPSGQIQLRRLFRSLHDWMKYELKGERKMNLVIGARAVLVSIVCQHLLEKSGRSDR